MAIIKESIHPSVEGADNVKSVRFTCPECKKVKALKIPISIINKSRQLTTVSIPKGLICKHHFQAFVDKNFAIRGYQKVDFELAYDLLRKKKGKKNGRNSNKFHKRLIIEGNYVEFRPLELKKFQKLKDKLFIKEEILSCSKNKSIKKVMLSEKKKRMSLEEIYDEFWDWIDNDNEEFKHLIEVDKRRESLS